MFRSLAAPVRAAVAFLLFASNTLLHALPLLALALVRLLLPSATGRRRLGSVLAAMAQSWVAVNSRLMCAFGTRIVVDIDETLDRNGWYLVICNHQSWVDIPVLQLVFRTRVPLLRFFLKRELIFVPVLGLAWWALDFPFMRRYSRAELERHPERRGKDLEATRRACEKFREVPVAIMNFVEGTRFTPSKHAAQQSPYRHLLLPRAGGVAFVVQAMRPLLHTVLDVSIAYPQRRPTVYDLLAGRVTDVRVSVHRREIPDGFADGDYENDSEFRERFQSWINTLWRDKDAQIDMLLR